jgi:hypothetical protein
MFRVFRKNGSSEPDLRRRGSNTPKSRNISKHPSNGVMRLQRSLGNQIVQRLIKSGNIMTKLMIGRQNDPAERDADQVADRVMQMPEQDIQRQTEPEEEEVLQPQSISNDIIPIVQKQDLDEDEEVRKQEEPEEEEQIQAQVAEEEEVLQPQSSLSENLPLAQRQEVDEDEEVQMQVEPEDEEQIQAQEQEEEEEQIQTKEMRGSRRRKTSDFDDRLNSLKSGGKPLPDPVRSSFENRFGHDFSGVRTHTGSEASDLAKSINAKAFTSGKDIVFGSGQYSTESGQGKRLIAHELSHTIQQERKHPLQQIQKSETFYIQRTPGPREDLQKKYKVTIEKGDKDWSADDIKDLEWVLAKLSKNEFKVLKGYKFIRWSTKEARAKKDPTYIDPGIDECGQHEADIAAGKYKISFYDKCFKDPKATSETMAGVPIERFHLMHEIGHAMEIAELRKKTEKYYKANDAYNAALDEYNKASAKQQNKMKAKIEKLSAAEKKTKTAWQAAQTRVLDDFKALIKGKTALTDYSKTNAMEAFAEAFALYKIDPKGLKKLNLALARWFKKGGHLHPVK